jgi:macrolide-specific efflux system membrane fusion protein
VRIPRALKYRKRWLIALVVAIVLGGGAGAWAATRPTKKASASTTTMVAASTATMRQTVTASGTLAPSVESDLTFAVAGTVTSVPASVGAKVAKGAVLATVGTGDLQAAVDSAQASLDAANAALTAASGSTAAQLASAQAQVTSAQSKVADAKASLAAATLRSPIAGTVAAVNVTAGDQVSGNGSSGSNSGNSGGNGSSGTGTGASSSSSSSSAQIVVISTSSWIVDASVESADLTQLKKGLQAEITPTDTTNRVFGTVTSIGIVASTSSAGSATFPVTIAITGSPTGLYAGGTANVTIIVKQLQDVLTVPTAAVHTVNGKTVVYQRRNGSQVDTPVTVGAVFGASTQIVSGLKDGDQVVVTTFGPGGAGGGTRQRTGNGGGIFNGVDTGGLPVGGVPSGRPLTGSTSGGK